MSNSNLRGAAAVITTMALICAAPSASGDLTPILQYEMTLGGGNSTGTFYFAYQPDGPSQVNAFDTDVNPAAALRIPVRSTDPRMRTTFKWLSTSMRAAPSEEKATAGEVLGILVGVTLYYGVPLYTFVKELEEAYELDLSGIEYPEVDPSLVDPLPSSPGVKQ